MRNEILVQHGIPSKQALHGAIRVTAVSGRCFALGEDAYLPRFNLVWYGTKREAEEAVAGQALDCLRAVWRRQPSRPVVGDDIDERRGGVEERIPP